MVLRLILVSIVAGLGATPPAENEIAGWSRTAQAWLDARLADWSICLPPNEGAFPLPPPAPADLGLATLDDELLALYGDEPVLEAPAPSPEPKATADAGLASLDEELAALFSEEPVAVVPPPIEDARTADRVFDAVVDEIAAGFSQCEDEPVAPVSRTLAPDLVASQAEIDELERAFVEAEDTEAYTFTIVPAPAVTALPVVEDEFLEPGIDFDHGVAPGSSRPTDEIGPPAPAIEEAPAAFQATTCDPLLDAVRLTRDAAYAWMNLLQSPAIATLPE
jgi:hypothetical protein